MAVIDDDEGIRFIFRELINRFVDCDVYDNPVEMISEIRPERYDLIISDYDCHPDISGLDIYDKLKDMGIPFILMSGTPREKIPVNGHKVEFVQKPFSAKELVEKIKSIIK